MHLGLWAADDDIAAHQLAATARSRGHAVTHVTPGRTGADATDLSAWVFGGVDLDPCTAHLVRELPSPFVTPDIGETPAEVARHAYEAQERVLLAGAALTALEARGARVVNPCASHAFESKPHQLAAFARARLAMPRTLVTSLPFAATQFVDALAAEGQQAIVKPLIGGATARLVDDAVRARFTSLAASPVILQERISGDDVRVTVVDARIISAVRIPSDALDYRDDPTYAAGAARYEAIALPAEAHALVLRAASLCHHVVSGVDLKLTEHGRFVVLEANASPRWLDIEKKTGARISDAILDVLAA
jgi:glutathione synthase/RimK-type ligase-like ATP-grasp enzyme